MINREKIVAWGTRKVRFPSQDELGKVLTSLDGRKRLWVWEHDDKEIAKTDNQNHIQLLLERVTAAHDGVFRLYHDALPNIPEGGADGKTLVYELNLKVSNVYNFVFDDAADLAPIRINMPRSVRGVTDTQWIYQAVPTIHQETESLLYLKEMFNEDEQKFIQELSSDLKWRLYGLKKANGRYQWTSDASKFLDSDGLPPVSAWLINEVKTWSDFDKHFQDNLMLLFELKAKMMPYAFKLLPSQTGNLILQQPSSGLYCLLTRRNRKETTPWVLQMSQEIQVLDRHESKSMSRHVIDHGSFSVVQFTSPIKEGDDLRPNNVVLSAPAQYQVYWHVVSVEQFDQDLSAERVIDLISAQKGWSLGAPVAKGQTFKMTNKDRAKKESGLLICAFEYYDTTKLTTGTPDVPADTSTIQLVSLDQAIKRDTILDDSSFSLVVPGVSQEEKPADHAVYLRRLITTVYMPPVCTAPILEVEPIRVATPDQVKLVIPTVVDRTQMFNGIRNQIEQEQKMQQFPGGGRSTPIVIAIQRIMNNRKNAAAFLETVPKDMPLETMSRAQLVLQLGLHPINDDTDAFWLPTGKQEYVAIHPGRMEGIKLFDMDPRKGLTREGAIWLRMSPELSQLGMDQFLTNVSYEPLLYRALQLTVRQNELLAKQRAERMVGFGVSTQSYYYQLVNKGRDHKAEVMKQRLDSLNRLYRMLYRQDISDNVRRMTAGELDSTYVQPLLKRPEKENRDFARQFWELPIRLFPGHITFLSTDVSFLTQDEIKAILWSTVEFVPRLIEQKHGGLPDPKVEPRFIRLFWIKMFSESTAEERQRIKDERSTFFLPGNPPLSKAADFNAKRKEARQTSGLQLDQFFEKFMFKDKTGPLREWPEGVMPLFESDAEELADALYYELVTPAQIPASNPKKDSAVALYRQITEFIHVGQLIAINLLRNKGQGLVEHQRAQAWAGYQNLVLTNIKKFWGPNKGRVSLVACEDSIPVVANIEDAMIILGVKKEGEKSQKTLDLLDSNMLLLVDDDWDDPFYQSPDTNLMYKMTLVDHDLEQLIEEIQEGLAVRKKSAEYYKRGIDAMYSNIRAITDFRKGILDYVEMLKKDYATFLEEQVKGTLKMETIRTIGKNLGQMTKPGNLIDIAQERGRSGVISRMKELEKFNNLTLEAIRVKSEFEQFWEKLEKYVVEQAAKFPEDISKDVMEDETKVLTRKKPDELADYIEMNKEERVEYQKKMLDDSKNRMMMNAAKILTQKKEAENRGKPIRLLDEFEKSKQINAGLDMDHPLEEVIQGITSSDLSLHKRLIEFYNYVAAKATNLSDFKEAFSVFRNVNPLDAFAFDNAIDRFLDPIGVVIQALYMIASDNRYNDRLIHIVTQPGLTLAHIVFHRFVHLINGLFVIVEQNYERITDQNREELKSVRDALRDLLADALRYPLQFPPTPADDANVSQFLREQIKERPLETLNQTIVFLDDTTKRTLFGVLFDDRDWFKINDPAPADVFFKRHYHDLTQMLYEKYYEKHYDTLIEWLRKNGQMQKDSFMRRADITPMQSRFFRPNANEPSGLSAAINTFLGMDPDKERDQTSLSRMVWALRQEDLQTDDRKKKEDEEAKKEYKFLRPLCGRAEDKGDVEQKTKRDEMTQDMLCPRKMLDLANAGLLWAIGDFYEKGPDVVEQIPRGSFFNLISRLLDSIEFLNMRMRFGLDPSMDKTQHAYAYKLGGTLTDDDQNPFVTMVGSRDLGPTEGYTEIDEEFAREVLNEIEAEQKGVLKALMDMTPRYNMTREAAHELWRLALFGRITSPHVVWTKEGMKLKDGLLLVDFLVELDKHITAAVKKDEALASFQPLSLLQSVWAFLKFYIMPHRAYQIVFLQQLHQDGRIIYDYFSPYAITSLLRNQFTYGLKEISPEPITWQWMLKFHSLREPFALPERTFRGLIEKDQITAREVLTETLYRFVFFYDDENGQGEPYQRILGQWDRSHDPFDPSTDLITGSGFVYTRDERWKNNPVEQSPWITVSPFAGLDTKPNPPEFPHGRDASYNVNTTMFETEESASIYEWRAGRRLYMRPNVFNANFFRRAQDDFFNWRLGNMVDLITKDISLEDVPTQWHLWPVLIAENHSLISWYNEWERKLDNHLSLLGFHRLFSVDPWKPPSQDVVDEENLLEKRKEQLEKVFKTRIDTLKKKIIKVLQEFSQNTHVRITVTTADLLGEGLDKWTDFGNDGIDEKSVAKMNNELTKAENGFSDFSARLKEWTDVFSQTFRQNEWLENNPDVTGLEEDPSILNYYYKEYSISSPFPDY